jgi:hypothetical protein
LEGWLRLGLDAKTRRGDRAAAVAANLRASQPRLAAQSGPKSLGSVTAIVVALKPQVAPQALPALAPLVSASTVVVSIMAGRTLQFLAGALKETRACARHAEYPGGDRARHYGRGGARTPALRSANSPIVCWRRPDRSNGSTTRR